MGPPSRTAEREEERRLNVRTLAIASVAAAAAALITSQLWIAGTWIAAAMTPVIVALVSEMLHRPTERIARRVTSERPALLPEAGGAAPPARPGADPLPERAPEQPSAGAGETEPPGPVRVYRSGSTGRPPRRRKIAYGVVFGTAALAFVIAVAALTVPELIAGGSVGKNDGGTTLFGDGNGNGERERDPQAPQDTAPEEESRPEEQERQPARPEEDQPAPPEEELPEDEAPPEETAPPGEPTPEAPVPPAEQPR